MDTAAASKTRPGVTLVTRIRAWLVLGRVSNLPTVWSNCLAACWLGGWNEPRVIVVLSVSATMLYVGGMYLNDVCDVEFDRRHRPERPIVSGVVTRRMVLNVAVALLFCGVILLATIQWQTAAWGCALAAAIAVYDVTHKALSAAPLIMGACRLLLYLTAASAGISGVTARVVAFGCALALYISGLSFVARAESGATVAARGWPWLMLFAPLLCAFATQLSVATIARSTPFLLCLGFAWYLLGRRRIGQAVSIFLAAIVFVDLLAVGSTSATLAVAFFGLFAAALLAQRYIPAT
jgi:4-hydroxybenzoate polyprenyltransferase